MKLSEAIQDMGARLGCSQKMYGSKEGVLEDYKKHKYNYKTDIPAFVDSIALPKIKEVMEKYKWTGEIIFYANGCKYELKKWLNDDGVVVRIDDNIDVKYNKKYFKQLYEERD